MKRTTPSLLMAEIWLTRMCGGGGLHCGRLTLAGVAAAGLVIRVHADLVGPKDLGILPLGLCFDGRVGFLQPLLDLVGILLARMPPGLLGGVAPAAQVRADGPFRQFDAELLANQVPDGAAAPQGRRDAQLLGA